MIQVDQVDTKSKKQVNEFVEFHYKLYRNCPQWVPPFYVDVKLMLNHHVLHSILTIIQFSFEHKNNGHPSH